MSSPDQVLDNRESESPSVSLGTRLQYWIVRILLGLIGGLPRPAAIALGERLALFFLLVFPKLKRVGMRNLELAFPEKPPDEHRTILRGAVRNLGRLLGEFAHFPRLTRSRAASLIVYDGLDHYLAARERGKGVIVLTAHFGVWELSAFAHGLLGHPMNILVRRIDNPLVEKLVENVRTASGNRTFDKNKATRAVLNALRNGETIGILSDLNMLRNQGVFCDFFGIPACTTPMPATLALRTGAAVVPGFLIWETEAKRYRLLFLPALELVETGNQKRDIEVNTARMTKVIEDIVRRYPDQWLWIHRRWKVRPDGEPDPYR